MKTTMIRDVLTVVSVGGPLSEDAPEAAQRATDELKALEESHAEMARALMDTAGYYRDVDLGTPCWCGLGVRRHRPHDARCEAALSALRKAGLL